MVTDSWGPYPPAALPRCNGGSISHLRFPSDPCRICLLPFPWGWAAHLPSFIILCCFSSLSLCFCFFIFLLIYLVIYHFFPCLSFILFHVYVFACLPVLQLVVAALTWAVLIQSSTELLDSPSLQLPSHCFSAFGWHHALAENQSPTTSSVCKRVRKCDQLSSCITWPLKWDW
jgi:hypothetical protein